MKTHLRDFRVRVDQGSYGWVFLYEDSDSPIQVYYSNDPVQYPNSPLFSSITTQFVKSRNFQKKIDLLFSSIREHHIENSTQKITETLNTIYIYPEIIKSFSNKNNKTTEYYQRHAARPVIEVLFFDHQDLFNRLLTVLLIRNENALYQAFLDSLNKSSLANENIALTDNTVKNKVATRIAELSEHLETVRDPAAMASIEQWIVKVNAHLNLYENGSASSSGMQQQLKQLQYNLVLLKVLRESDGVILPQPTVKDRARLYYSRFLNVLSIIALGIPFFINKLITGKWFFAPPLTTADYFSNAQNSLLSSPEKITYATEQKSVQALPAAVTTPLQAITHQPDVPGWTLDHENQFQLVLTKLVAAGTLQYQPDAEDKAILKIIIRTYIETGDIESFNRVLAVCNTILELLDKECSGNPKEILSKLYGLDTPVTDFIQTQIGQPIDYYDDNVTKPLEDALKIKFGFDLSSTATLFGPKGSHHVYDAPPGSSFTDVKDKIPHRSLSTLALPKYIDAVLTRLDAESYAKAKQDPDFQKIVIDLVNLNRKSAFSYGLHQLLMVYRGQLNALADIPHLFINKNDTIAMYPATQLHPVLLRIAKFRFKQDMKTEAPHRSRVLSQIVGHQMFKDIYPEYKDWSLLPKNGGKDPGFILESPDRKQRLYVKCTKSMFIELLAANLFNQLGIKMAESSLFFNDEGNCFFVTRSLTRQYEKIAGLKHKLFQPFCEAYPRDPAHETKAKYDFENADDDNSRDDFINEMLSHNAHLTKTSFAKLLIAGIALGLNDLGGHGGNVGPLTTNYNGNTTVKMGIVDYGVDNVDHVGGSCPSLKAMQNFLVDRFSNSTPIFQNLVKRLSVEDIEQALKQLQSPKCYFKNSKGYLQKHSKARVSYQQAIEAAVQETFEQLEIAGVLNEELSKSLSDYQTHVLKRLTYLLNALDAPAAENTNQPSRLSLSG